MGGSQSKTSFRVTGLPSGISDASFSNVLEALSIDSDQGIKSRVASRLGLPVTSPPVIAPRGTICSVKAGAEETEPSPIVDKVTASSSSDPDPPRTGTISCSSKIQKEHLMEKCRKLTGDSRQWTGAKLEDKFTGLTLLSSPKAVEIEIDICFVHGLNGNGMDTFAKKKEGSPVVIWPRDILPKVDGFQNTRIMTFDYNSKILDRSDDTRPSDWAKDLLHCVNIAREGSTLENRPIIFIGHSMGGIVVRFAAALLFHDRSNSEPNTTNTYPTMHIRNCGFLFLATPHQGSTMADSGVIGLARWHQILSSRSHKMIKFLSSVVNSDLEDNLKTWVSIQSLYNCPLDCYAEARDSRILGRLWTRRVVSETSAQFMVTGRKIPDTDHFNICRVETQHDSHFLNYILPGIRKMKGVLLVRAASPELVEATDPSVVKGDINVNACLQLEATRGATLYAGILDQLVDFIPASRKKSCIGQVPMKGEMAYFLSMLINATAATTVRGGESGSATTPDDPTDKLKAGPSRIIGGQQGTTAVSGPSSANPQQNTSLREAGSHSGRQDEPVQPDSIREAWEKKAILSIDGGSVRSFVSLLLLKELMKKVAIKESETNGQSIDESSTPKGTLPSHCFDYIVGTGTGGLLAIMLGRLRMNIDDCIDEFKRQSRILFPPRAPLFRLLGVNRKRQTTTAERIFKDVTDKFSPDVNGEAAGELKFADPVSGRCKTAVLATLATKYGSNLDIIRSYPAPWPLESSTEASYTPKEILVWQAARATSSTPLFFEKMRIGDSTYTDARDTSNNPAAAMWNEAKECGQGQLSVLVSLGTGLPNDNMTQAEFYSRGRMGFTKQTVTPKRHLRAVLIDSETQHHQVDSTASAYKTPYYRLNVPMENNAEWGLQSWGNIDDKTFDKLHKETMLELEATDGKPSELMELIDKCAQELVDQRRLRAKDAEAWATFTSPSRATTVGE